VRLESVSHNHLVKSRAAAQLLERAAEAPASSVRLECHPVVLQKIPANRSGFEACPPKIRIAPPPLRVGRD